MIPNFPTPGAAYDRTDESQFRASLWKALSAIATRIDLLVGTSEFFNVRDYGALGDDSTDDSVAFALADAAAVAVDGVVLVPAGVYSIQDDVTLDAAYLFAGGTVKPDASSTIEFTGPTTALAGVWEDSSDGGTIIKNSNTYQKNSLLVDDNLDVLGDATVVGKFGCNGASAQLAYASGGSADATAATDSSPFGYTESQANGIVTLLNNIRAALVADGIMS